MSSSSLHEQLAGAGAGGAADQMRDGEDRAALSAALRSKALEIARDVSAGATAGGEKHQTIDDNPTPLIYS